MRILSGKYKGRVLKMPKGIRPTQDKVRKALFDILRGWIEDARVLELFAGSGAVGIEALSEGAKGAVFIEQDSQCVKVIQENLQALGIKDALVLAVDACSAVQKFAAQKKAFELVFLDPPYYEDMAKKTLQCLGDYDILTANGLAVVEHFKRDQLPEKAGTLVLWRMEKYGDSMLSFYRKNDVS